ncbi:hypothetical protein BDM02DRAFT_3117084 [Thelephora ganbajun]|uniref:Uncharacterized protein n=1 Tax=Thelephora ganbajun TaxID=370292 RepID=A0ACB6ZCA3_THEGA|nr:hypothetical protein BDM02DRAFT_3117084 [Thelephora ganbajun]
MPPPKKDLPPEFEISSREPGKVRCRTCESQGYEPWIRRSSVKSHLKCRHHRGSEVSKKRDEERQERLRQKNSREAERSAALWEAMFLAPEDIPSIQVKAREGVTPAHPVSVEGSVTESRPTCLDIPDTLHSPTSTPVQVSKGSDSMAAESQESHCLGASKAGKEGSSREGEAGEEEDAREEAHSCGGVRG